MPACPRTPKPLGGWEAPNGELRGHFEGHYLSACALLYGATGDKAVKAKADELVAGLAECQAKLNQGGYLSAYPSEFFDRLDKRQNVWAPFYTMHKIMAGLLDMKTEAGNDQALDVVTKMAGWVDGWTASKTEEHMQDILNTEYGGMNEMLYNLAAITGDDRWAHTGDRFTKKIFFTPLVLRTDELKGQHMNTHVPQVIGAARRYELSSDYRFRDVSQFFWETVSEARTYATGGSSNNEHWLVDPDHLAAGDARQFASPGVLLQLQHDEARAPPSQLERRQPADRLLRAQPDEPPAGHDSAGDRTYGILSLDVARQRGRRPAPRMTASGAAPAPGSRSSPS